MRGSFLGVVKEVAGVGQPLLYIATSCLLIISFIFYLYIASSQINFGIYPFYNRVTYYTFFDAHVINEWIDHLILFSSTAAWLFLSLKEKRYGVVAVGVFAAAIAFHTIGIDGWPLDVVALASIPAMIMLLILDRGTGMILHFRLQVLGKYFVLTSLLLGVAGLVLASAFIAGFQDQTVRNYSYELFVIFYSLSPFLIIVLVASAPIKMIIESVRQFLKRREGEEIQELRIEKRKKVYYLSFFMALSIAMGIIPHLSTINSNGQIIGVDTGYYVNWVGSLVDSQNPQEFIENAFIIQARGDRPVTLIFIYAIAKLVNSDLTLVVEYLPIILGPGLVLTVYWLTREITKDERTSLVASFITAVSFHVLIGIYAGFYANWFALITGYLGIIFLLRYLRESRNRDLIAFSGLLLLTLLAHVYTWSILAIVIGVFLAVTLYRKPNERKAAIILFMILGLSVAIDIGRIVLTESTGGIERDLEFADTLTGPDQFTQRFNSLRYTATTFVGGIFGGVVILALGLYWMYRARVKDQSSILLFAFFSVGLIPIVIGDWVVQTRILYNIPFQIPAAIGLMYLKQKPVGNLLFVTVCIWLVFLAVRTVSNFYFVSPSGQ